MFQTLRNTFTPSCEYLGSCIFVLPLLHSLNQYWTKFKADLKPILPTFVSPGL